jgi:predicted alpha/beta-hydrolase family hydrolase
MSTLQFQHLPASSNGVGVVLTHGAGSNAQAPLLIAIGDQLAHAGFHVLRIDLAFRQERPTGPPSPAGGAKDRAGIAAAAEFIRGFGLQRVVLSGHSYGGRQCTMLAAEQPSIANALLLFSYPLHPPRKPDQLRTAHFSKLRTPSLFVHGTRDPFGSPAEMDAALPLIAASHQLSLIDKAGHELAAGKFDMASKVIEPLEELLK